MDSEEQDFNEEIEDIPKKKFKKKNRANSQNSSDSYNLEGEIIKTKKKNSKKKFLNKKRKKSTETSSHSDLESDS